MEVKAMTTNLVYGQIDAAATSMTIGIFTTHPNIYIMQIFVRVKTAFAGVTKPSVELGITGQTELYIPKQGIGVAGDLVTAVSRGNMLPCKTSLSFQKTPANIKVDATFRSSSGNLSSLSAGEIEFVCVYCE